jgi:hypothetical protein
VSFEGVATCRFSLVPSGTNQHKDRTCLTLKFQVDTEVALDAELSNKHFCLDDPEQRQHYTNGPHPDRNRSAAGLFRGLQ